ncbi:MAG TPA: hypothetical protein VI197_08295 [Polyangiaceae bacterium]
MIEALPGTRRHQRLAHVMACSLAVAWSCSSCTALPAGAPYANPRTATSIPTVVTTPAPVSDSEFDAPRASAGAPAAAAIERVALALFGESIGPEFASGDEASLAPPGYTAGPRTWLDFGANGTEDVLVTLERDPESDPQTGPACVLVLGIEVAPSRYRVGGINGHGFACSPAPGEGEPTGVDVEFAPSEHGHDLVITVSQSGDLMSETWSYQVSYDVTTWRFVVAKLDYVIHDHVRMIVERATLYPLEGRGERAANEAEPTSVRLPPRRVLFEDLDDETRYDLLRF